LHYCCDETLREVATRATVRQTRHNLAIFSNLVIALRLSNGYGNLAKACRLFDAKPDKALDHILDA